MKDVSSNEYYKRSQMISDIKEIFTIYGGEPLDTPILEKFETVQNLYGEGFSKEVFVVKTKDNCDKIMRYDLTLPFCRYIGTNKIKIFRGFRIGKVFRNDDINLKNGRYKEFYQADFDIVGSDNGSKCQEGEILSLLTQCLTKILKQQSRSNGARCFMIRYNDKNLLEALLKSVGVTNEQLKGTCTTLDKLDEIGFEGVSEELLTVRKLPNKVITDIETLFKRLSKFYSLTDVIEQVRELVPDEIIQDLTKLNNVVIKLGIESRYLKFSCILARGLDYYTGLIFEAKMLSLPTPFGKLTRTSSMTGRENLSTKCSAFPWLKTTIASGGRYDKVIGKFTRKGTTVESIGLSLGIERLLLITKNENFQKPIPKIYVASVGKDMLYERQKLVDEFRISGISCVTGYSKSPKMQGQFTYVIEKNIPYMIVLGSDEISKGTLKFKDIKRGPESEIEISRDIETVKNLISGSQN